MQKHNKPWITDEEQVMLAQCRNTIKEIDSTAELILYGSRARGDHQKDSDYDFLVLLDGTVTAHREELFRNALYDIELQTGKALTIFALNKSDWNSPLYRAMPFHQNVLRDGIPL